MPQQEKSLRREGPWPRTLSRRATPLASTQGHLPPLPTPTVVTPEYLRVIVSLMRSFAAGPPMTSREPALGALTGGASVPCLGGGMLLPSNPKPLASFGVLADLMGRLEGP